MSELRDFVSELDVEQERKRRQEEWERVRKPDQPLEAPEPEIDSRPLYVRLREQREKAQLEFEQAVKLQHSVRGIDEDELEFFEQVDRKRQEAEQRIRSEEAELIAAIRKTVNASNSGQTDAAPIEPAPVIPKRPVNVGSSKQSKQALLLAGAIRKKKTKPTDSTAVGHSGGDGIESAKPVSKSETCSPNLADAVETSNIDNAGARKRPVESVDDEAKRPRS